MPSAIRLCVSAHQLCVAMPDAREDCAWWRAQVPRDALCALQRAHASSERDLTEARAELQSAQTEAEAKLPALTEHIDRLAAEVERLQQELDEVEAHLQRGVNSP